MQMLKTTLACMALALAATSATAADPMKKGEGAEVLAACKADMQKLCPAVQPGEGRVMQCLRQNRASVSGPCKTALKDARREQKQSAPAASTKGSG